MRRVDVEEAPSGFIFKLLDENKNVIKQTKPLKLEELKSEKVAQELLGFEWALPENEQILREIGKLILKLKGEELETLTFDLGDKRIKITASDGFQVPETNFFVKWENEAVVGELTYVHVKIDNGDGEGKRSIEPCLVVAKWKSGKLVDRGVFFIRHQEPEIVLADEYPIVLERKTFASSGIPTLMKRETISSFLKGSIAPNFREIFDLLVKKVKSFINFDWDERLYHLVCCYIIGTYFCDIFSSFPILTLYGDWETGKTRGVKTVTWASHRGFVCLSPTEAVMFRTIDAIRPTFGIDEFTKLSEDILRIARASYKKGEKVPRVEKVKKEVFILGFFETFSPLVVATTEELPEMLASRSIVIVMRRAPDPNPEKRDPEPEDFIDIREQLYLARLTRALDVYQASKEIDKLELGLYGRDYEIFKPVLTIAKLIGEDVFERVLSLARDMVFERREELHKEEKLLLEAIGQLFKERGYSDLNNQITLEFSASEVQGKLIELLLADEYGGDEKLFKRDWSTKKIGRRLARMGLKRRRTSNRRLWIVSAKEFQGLCLRYGVSRDNVTNVIQPSLAQQSQEEAARTKLEQTEENPSLDEKSSESPQSDIMTLVTLSREINQGTQESTQDKTRVDKCQVESQEQKLIPESIKERTKEKILEFIKERGGEIVYEELDRLILSRDKLTREYLQQLLGELEEEGKIEFTEGERNIIRAIDKISEPFPNLREVIKKVLPWVDDLEARILEILVRKGGSAKFEELSACLSPSENLRLREKLEHLVNERIVSFDSSSRVVSLSKALMDEILGRLNE